MKLYFPDNKSCSSRVQIFLSASQRQRRISLLSFDFHRVEASSYFEGAVDKYWGARIIEGRDCLCVDTGFSFVAAFTDRLWSLYLILR